MVERIVREETRRRRMGYTFSINQLEDGSRLIGSIKVVNADLLGPELYSRVDAYEIFGMTMHT